MSVLHPTLLAAGLAAVALPILIHLLLRRRYTPIRWAAMRFILEAQKQQRRRRRLEQILLLVARCLVVAMIALAVARPLIGSPASDRERTVVLVVDNALASRTTIDSGERAGETDLDRSKRLALEEIDRLRPAMGDRVAVVAAASPAEALIASPTGDLDAARAAIERIAPADSAPDFAGALALAGDALGPDDETRTGEVSAVILSAWRVGSIGPGTPATAGESDDRSQDDRQLANRSARAVSFDVVLSPPAENERPNLRIRSVSIPRLVLLASDTPAVRQAVVRIDRTGPAGDAVRGEVVCEIGSGTQARTEPTPFEIPAGARETAVSVELPLASAVRSAGNDAGYASAIASFTLRAPPAADAIESDSTRRLAVRLADGVDAGLVRSRGIRAGDAGIPAEAWVGAALRPDETAPIRLREIAHAGLDSAALIGLDAVFLPRPDLLTPNGWAALSAFVDAGGALVVFAPPLEGAHAWVDDAAARFPSFDGLAREASELEPPQPLMPGPAADALGLLGAELESLAGAVRVSRTLAFPVDPTRDVLATASGLPVVARPADRVWVVTTAISPAWSDLAARPIFPALLQEIARQSPTRGVSLTADAGDPATLPAEIDRLAPQSPTADDREQPRAITARDATRGLRAAGSYDAIGTASQSLGVLAVNPRTDAGDTATAGKQRVASALGETFPEGIRWLDGDANTADAAWNSDTSLALWAFAAAALLAVVESVIALTSGRRTAALARSTADPKRPGASTPRRETRTGRAA